MPDSPTKRGTVSRTGAGLNELLFRGMEDLLDGIIKPDEASALAGLAHQTIDNARLNYQASKDKGVVLDDPVASTFNTPAIDVSNE